MRTRVAVAGAGGRRVERAVGWGDRTCEHDCRLRVSTQRRRN